MRANAKILEMIMSNYILDINCYQSKINGTDTLLFASLGLVIKKKHLKRIKSDSKVKLCYF